MNKEKVMKHLNTVLMVIMIIGFIVSTTAIAVKMNKKQCYDTCDSIQVQDVQTCLDTNQWPLTPCVKKAKDDMIKCRSGCLDSK